ncbi:TonB family protein [Novosphingobium sp. CF614]|uniref:TonB family protein n=1 Tax=Novosphingobium sp. CF614 TaxID=1884364 RepID=UPI000B85C2EE|nr:TonB family protein [Novosphingobium sp. CF614]
MTRADLAMGHRMRWGVAGLVLLIHIVMIAGLIRAFTPQFAATVVHTITQAFTVPMPSRSPPVDPASPRVEPQPREGAASAPGKKARPRAVEAPRVTLAVKPTPAPPIPGQGDASASGARAEGEGAGASGTGIGMGSGASGAGQGGGSGSPTVKIAGDINSAKDYPRASRDLRIGAAVTVELAIGADGRVRACRVVQPSPDAQADRITCELATRRFRFRPAADGAGNPIEAIYRWRQRWFY